MTNRTSTLNKIIFLLVAATQAFPLGYAATINPSPTPLTSQTGSEPNLIMGIDDSGSMDFEVMLTTNDGALWWDLTNKSFTNNTSSPITVSGLNNVTVGVGQPWFNAVGNAANGGTVDAGGTSTSWYKYAYLFPDGSGTDARINTDATYDHFGIPPTIAYAFLRSAAWNPLYYNSNTTYTPWYPAYISGATVNYSNATPTAARSHPQFSSTPPVTIDLTNNVTAGTTSTTSRTGVVTISGTKSNWTFRMMPGMIIPAGAYAKKSGGSWTQLTANTTVATADSYYDADISYFPATFFVPDSSCTSANVSTTSVAWADSVCALAPDGTYLRKYEIKGSNTYPSGRTTAAELQNFANWFTYYRKRKLMLGAAMGSVLSSVNSLRGGTVKFNSQSAVTMYDFSSTSDSSNVKPLLGAIYQNAASGGTPTRETLKYIGGQFARTDSAAPIQNGCQRNSAFILTDGFANATAVTPPSYANTWVTGQPYTVITGNTLADIAASYYTNNPRSDLPTGLLAADNTSASNPDRNTNLHMTTFGMTLGAKGTIFGTGSASATDPFANPPTWPNPSQNRNPTAVDDLWHATIVGRGQMFVANNVSEATTYFQRVIQSLLAAVGSDAAVTPMSPNLTSSNNTLFSSSYNAQNWTGELAAYTINLSTGAASTTATWTAQSQLTAMSPTARHIATFDPSTSTAVPFTATASGVSSATQTAMANTGVTPSDGATVINYIRGDRTQESATTNTYRTRAGLLGDIVTADPVYVFGPYAQYTDAGYSSMSSLTRAAMVYQAANDGMLHAFNATTGAEVWAYVPSGVLTNLKALTNPLYTHQFYVDATPTTGDFYNGTDWKTMLAGGLRAGGKGYYALDITAPAASSDADVASKLLWEFPGAGTTTAQKNNVGLSYGQPILAKTRADGWVVLVSSGYNNSAGDGQGHLFVLNATTGAVLKDIPTGAGSASSPSGLAQISAYAANPQYDATIDYVYGGDLSGNVWRFDLTGATDTAWTVAKLATLVDGSGNAQPVTTVPALAVLSNGKHVVYVGTGKMLETSDMTTTATQSMYALVDDLSATPTITPLRTSLQQKTVTVNSTTSARSINADAVNYTTKKGWYFDLPGTGERVTTTPELAYGALIFTTNQPSNTACSSRSYLYAVSATDGGQLPASAFPSGTTPWSGILLGATLASAPKVTNLPNGTQIINVKGSNGQLYGIPVQLSGSGTLTQVMWQELTR
ncbi:type IV pilus assembly protein PilY1 [Silvimonas terrae]|uniref:Type IV pilus assembly protein PilY1 n=1 Tax=Silvimonas terrae TaxID=300266 RepID=A0A840RG01_9NEIS|nr:PilC/PilY family type IV pilus protein [Silvimonas terrae]MBB5191977.1 type IV pilus assembly protein PilY1 [Silvimonas terrae]